MTSTLDPNAYFTDLLFRSPNATATATGAQDFRGEAARILTNGAIAGDVSADDRTYLAELVAANTGLSAEEAQTRVDQV